MILKLDAYISEKIFCSLGPVRVIHIFLKSLYSLNTAHALTIFMTWQGGLLGNFFGRFTWEVISLSADGVTWFLILPALYSLSHHRWSWKPSTSTLRVLGIALVADLLLIVALKQVFKRKRPSRHRPDFRFVGPDHYSFPSGHATRAWMLAGLAQHAAGLGSPAPAPAPHLALAWALTVSIGRLALGRHYLTDVLCGAAVGWLITLPLSLRLQSGLFPAQ